MEETLLWVISEGWDKPAMWSFRLDDFHREATDIFSMCGQYRGGIKFKYAASSMVTLFTSFHPADVSFHDNYIKLLLAVTPKSTPNDNKSLSTAVQ